MKGQGIKYSASGKEPGKAPGIRYFLRNILVLAFLAAATPSFAQNGLFHRLKGPGKKQLILENAELRARIDSLQSDLERYALLSANPDSLESPYTDPVESNYRMSAAGLYPEDYNDIVTDSLVSIWYAHKQVQESYEGGFENMDSVHFISDVPDSVLIRRLEDMNSFITLPFNETVRDYIVLYSQKMPTKMGYILGLCTYYMPFFEETLDKYQMPLELKVMAIIESALDPLAVSRANAKGMWQFVYSTGHYYGLRIDSFVDERFDPIKSADAAARYLRDAYSLFGDWPLAISAYNCGIGNVNKAIKRSGSRNFWDIYDYLPRETRGYVPAFVGALYTVNYYKEHGIVPQPANMPASVDTINVRHTVHFEQISALTGIATEELRNLNPQYIRDIIPGKPDDPLTLRLPYNYTGSFIENEDSIYVYKADELLAPMTLSSNKPASSAKKSSKKSSGASSGAASGAASASGGSVYVVKKGDNLYNIAKNYPGVSAQDIMDYNNIGSSLKIGQKIRIPSK